MEINKSLKTYIQVDEEEDGKSNNKRDHSRNSKDGSRLTTHSKASKSRKKDEDEKEKEEDNP